MFLIQLQEPECFYLLCKNRFNSTLTLGMKLCHLKTVCSINSFKNITRKYDPYIFFKFLTDMVWNSLDDSVTNVYTVYKKRV